MEKRVNGRSPMEWQISSMRWRCRCPEKCHHNQVLEVRRRTQPPMHQPGELLRARLLSQTKQPFHFNHQSYLNLPSSVLRHLRHPLLTSRALVHLAIVPRYARKTVFLHQPKTIDPKMTASHLALQNQNQPSRLQASGPQDPSPPSKTPSKNMALPSPPASNTAPSKP